MAVCRLCNGSGRNLRCPCQECSCLSCDGTGTVHRQTRLTLTKGEARALFFRPRGWRVKPLEYIDLDELYDEIGGEG